MNGLMFMCLSKYIFLLFLLYSLVVFAHPHEGDGINYKTYQCMSYVALIWDENITRDEKINILNLINLPNIHQIESYIQGWSKPYQSGIYFEYTSRCKDKTQMSKKIMTHLKKTIPNFPDYLVTEAVIYPCKYAEYNCSWQTPPSWKKIKQENAILN